MSHLCLAGVAIVVGKSIGDKDASRASKASWLGLMLALSSSGVATVLLVLFREQAIQIFGAAPELEKLTSDFVPWIALFILVDSTQISLSGTITGAGKQAVSVPILLVSYFAIGTPLGAALTFYWPKWGLLGLWLGITAAASLHCIAFMLVCFTRCPGSIRWDKVINEATDRLEQPSEDEEQSGLQEVEIGAMHSQLDDKDAL